MTFIRLISVTNQTKEVYNSARFSSRGMLRPHQDIEALKGSFPNAAHFPSWSGGLVLCGTISANESSPDISLHSLDNISFFVQKPTAIFDKIIFTNMLTFSLTWNEDFSNRVSFVFILGFGGILNDSDHFACLGGCQVFQKVSKTLMKYIENICPKDRKISG